MPRILAGLLIVLLLFGVGVYAGRRFFPRVEVQQVDREILRIIEKEVPGQTKEVVKEVAGKPVVVEVTRYIDRPGAERIVTITKPVNVPVETIRTEWPQFITVTIGGVLDTEGVWRIPKFKALTIGQVAPGAYAVSSQMEGWRVESVATETRITPSHAPAFHVELRPTVGVMSLGGSTRLAVGVQVEVSKGHFVGQLGGGPGWGLLFASYRF